MRFSREKHCKKIVGGIHLFCDAFGGKYEYSIDLKILLNVMESFGIREALMLPYNFLWNYDYIKKSRVMIIRRVLWIPQFGDF